MIFGSADETKSFRRRNPQNVLFHDESRCEANLVDVVEITEGEGGTGGGRKIVGRRMIRYKHRREREERKEWEKW